MFRTGSDSDLSQASFRQANTFPYMNTMQHNLGVILGSSPLINMITSMGSKLNTRDSFDNGIAHRNVSVESITTTMINNYRQDLAKNAAEIGDAHLQMLRTVSCSLAFSFCLHIELIISVYRPVQNGT
jgi:hypothetical protein